MSAEDKTLPQIPSLPENITLDGNELFYMVKNGADWSIELSRFVKSIVYGEAGTDGKIVKFSPEGTLIDSLISEVLSPYSRVNIDATLVIDGDIYASGNIIGNAEGGPGDAPSDPLNVHAASIATPTALGHIKASADVLVDANGVATVNPDIVVNNYYSKSESDELFSTFNDLDSKADLVNGLIPANQLPSYVDDVLEYANIAAFPVSGESGKLYIAIDTNLVYRWGGSIYVVTSSSLALGETSGTAYRGDRGKTAYDHSQVAHNAALVGLGNVTNESKATMFNNPSFTGQLLVQFENEDDLLGIYDVATENYPFLIDFNTSTVNINGYDLIIGTAAGSPIWKIKLSSTSLEFYNSSNVKCMVLDVNGNLSVKGNLSGNTAF